MESGAHFLFGNNLLVTNLTLTSKNPFSASTCLIQRQESIRRNHECLRTFKGLFSRRNQSPSLQSDNATASISASPTNNGTSAPGVNPQGEYAAILELSTTPSALLTWEHRMNEWGSTTYDGLKTAIQGIYDFSGTVPPLQTTAGVLLTISKVVDVRGSVCSTCKHTNNVS